MERVEIASVDDDRPPQRLLDADEIRMSVLVPVGDDDQRIGAVERLIARGARTQRRPPSRCLASSIATGSCAMTRAPAASNSSMSASAGLSRKSSVFGLNARPHTATARP